MISHKEHKTGKNFVLFVYWSLGGERFLRFVADEGVIQLW